MRQSSRPDMTARIGAVTLENPVLAASGCFGAGAEMLGSVDASRLGGVVTKSLSAEPWPGNPAPRLAPLDGGGMLNAVGLQNPGVGDWVARGLPALEAAGVTVVASLWGGTVADFAAAAEGLAPVSARLAAVEVNISCPNLDHGREMFAHVPADAAEVVRAVRPPLRNTALWVKLSPNLPSVVAVAEAVLGAGADGLVLTNTLMGTAIDAETRRFRVAHGTGGVSGPPLRPVALRHVWECARAFPGTPLVGVGGISRAEHAVEFLLAGACAVEVGAAHFADPAAGVKVVRGLARWCRRRGVPAVGELVGAVEGM